MSIQYVIYRISCGTGIPVWAIYVIASLVALWALKGIVAFLFAPVVRVKHRPPMWDNPIVAIVVLIGLAWLGVLYSQSLRCM